MISDPEITVAFTGHRSYDGSCDDTLYTLIERLHMRGFRVFLCGMAAGFDMAAAEAVLRYKRRGNDLSLVCVLPFPGQADRFSSRLRLRYDALLREASDIVTICDRYEVWCYHRRNDYLVDNSSVLVAYYNGSAGGTRYTVRRAVNAGHEVINLIEDIQQKLPCL